MWNFQASANGTISGAGVSDDDQPGDAVKLAGQLSGTALTFSITGTNTFTEGGASGTSQGGSVSGSWQVEHSDGTGSGSFSGSVCP